VGELARERFPGGVLIDTPHWNRAERVARTQDALAGGVPAVFEASFLADGVSVAVDVLERMDGGRRLIEVKSASSQKDEHLPDVAVQVHVAEASGVPIHVAGFSGTSEAGPRCPERQRRVARRRQPPAGYGSSLRMD